MVAGGKEIEVIEKREGTDALWHIGLNSLLPEPLVTIYVNNKPLIVLADSGSEVNCISSQQDEHLGLIDRIYIYIFVSKLEQIKSALISALEPKKKFSSTWCP
jgi:hypothetical protein